MLVLSGEGAGAAPAGAEAYTLARAVPEYGGLGQEQAPGYSMAGWVGAAEGAHGRGRRIVSRSRRQKKTHQCVYFFLPARCWGNPQQQDVFFHTVPQLILRENQYIFRFFMTTRNKLHGVYPGQRITVHLGLLPPPSPFSGKSKIFNQ
jgi:hypothetical protein